MPSASAIAGPPHAANSRARLDLDRRRGYRDGRLDAPYGMLQAVIARASARGLQQQAGLGKRRAGAGAERETEPRPNIQARRSSTAGSSRPVSGDSGFMPLAFDRRVLAEPPLPPPPVDRFCRPPRDGDFFASFVPAADQQQNGAGPGQGRDRMPRSSSAPSVPLRAANRRGSDASRGSGVSSMSEDTPGHRPPHQHHAPGARSDGRVGTTPSDQPSDQPVASPQSAIHFAKWQTPAYPRHAATKAQPHTHSIDQVPRDPPDLSSYLDPEMSATLCQRMSQGSAPSSVEQDSRLIGLGITVDMVGSSGLWTGGGGKKKESFSEDEWSFEGPLFNVMGKALEGRLGLIDEAAHYNLVEYGCHKETPNPVLAETIKSLCLRSSDTRTPKVFSVTHQATPYFDARLLQSNLHTHPTSYRKAENIPPIPFPLILTSFSFAGFAESALPADTVNVAFCSGELCKLQGTVAPRPLYAFTSQAEEKEKLAEHDLVRWLKARAKELKKGGILVCSLAIKTRQPVEHESIEPTAPPNPPKASPYNAPASLPASPQSSVFRHTHVHTPFTEIVPSIFPAQPQHHLKNTAASSVDGHRYRQDMYQLMSKALGPAIQRLVTLGEIRTHVAPMLVDLPYWPRALEHLRSAFAKATEWNVLRDCETELDVAPDVCLEDEMDALQADFSASMGNDDTDRGRQREEGDAEKRMYPAEEEREWAEAGVRIHRLSHPAWRAFKQGRIDRMAYAKRVAMYCHSVYEPHLKRVLREKGRMDISHSENTIQEMFKILVEKCELGALDDLAVDVGVIVFQRK